MPTDTVATSATSERPLRECDTAVKEIVYDALGAATDNECAYCDICVTTFHIGDIRVADGPEPRFLCPGTMDDGAECAGVLEDFVYYHPEEEDTEPR